MGSRTTPLNSRVPSEPLVVAACFSSQTTLRDERSRIHALPDQGCASESVFR